MDISELATDCFLIAVEGDQAREVDGKDIKHAASKVL